MTCSPTWYQPSPSPLLYVKSRFRYGEIFSGYRVSTRSVATRGPLESIVCCSQPNTIDRGEEALYGGSARTSGQNYNSTGTGATTVYYDGNYDGNSEYFISGGSEYCGSDQRCSGPEI